MIDISKILEKMHISELNAMQQETYNVVLHSNRDVVILSPTGSGKTLAYLLPLMQLLDGSKDDVQAVVIVPGRELALQSMTVLQDMSSGIQSYACYGGRSTMDEHKILRHVQPQIVFTTPGRLNDHLDKGNIAADTIKYLVIDEFDKCLEMGFSDEMSAILDKLPALERRFLLSATDAESIPQFVNMGRTQRIDFLASEEQVSDRVTIYKVISPEKDKLNILARLLRSLGDESSIVFLNYRDSVERTDEFLCNNDFSTSAFHGGLEQKQREDALYKFSNGSANIFVSTDLASRGLDIPDIDNIIHYHLPESEDGYIHRVGRTARWDKQGRTFFILGQQEQIPEYVKADIDTYDIPDELPSPARPKMCTLYIGKGKKDKISKGDIVGFLCKQGKIKSSDIGRVDVKERYSYAAIRYEKFPQVLKLTNGEKIKGIRTVTESVK